MQIYTFAAEKSNKIKMSEDIRLKKGLNIQLVGEAEQVYSTVNDATTYELKPSDFHGLTPKLAVKLGDKVKAGTVLFFDKYNEKVKPCSPLDMVKKLRYCKRSKKKNFKGMKLMPILRMNMKIYQLHQDSEERC